MSKPDIARLIAFQRLLLNFSHVARVVQRPVAATSDKYIAENDTEHSYNLAMTAWFLASYFPELNPNRVIRYALVHDLVEIHAGDTYIYADAATLASKSKREAAALEQLEAEWPDFSTMTETIHEYEAKDTPEAQFVYALDKIMPIMLIYISQGYTWHKEGITLKQLDAIKRTKVSVSAEIQPYYEQLYELLVASPHLIPIR